MGCGLSKIDSQLVKLCREKRELIKGARDWRNALAFAYLAYLQSMNNVGDGLQLFLEEALVICFDSDSETGVDHRTVVDVLRSECPFVGPDGDVDADDDVEDDGPDGDDDKDEEDVSLSYTDYVNRGLRSSEPRPENVTGELPPSVNLLFPSDGNGISFADPAYCFPNSSGLSNYETTNSTDYQTDLRPNSFWPSQDETATPSSSTMSSLPNFGFNPYAGGVSFGGRTDYSVMDSRFFQHERSERDYTMDFPSNNFVHNQASWPSNPLPHEFSTWDYVNPFNLAEDTFPTFNFPDTYETRFGTNDMDFRELREREGIPDLEYELDHSIVEETSSEEYLGLNGDINGFLSEEAALKDRNDVYPDQKEDVRSKGDGTKTNDLESGPSSSAIESLKVEEVIGSEAREGQEESIQKEMDNTRDRQNLCSETVTEFNSNTLVHSPKELGEILNQIKGAFGGSSMHEKDVLEMLGSYEPGFTSCIKRSAASSRKTPAWACGMLKRSAHRILKLANDSSESLENETSPTLCNLSLTLEKLCILESKLYEEIKVEEKLSDNIEKGCKKLRDLDERGADPSKVVARLSAQKLTPRMEVAISTIEGIARRTHKIRDEELQPQLCGLIDRLHKMWKFFSEAYRKQVEAIIRAQANVKMTCMTNDSSLTATLRLEAGIIQLGIAFSNWIKGQIAFAKLLKNWLATFLLQESGDIHLTPTLFFICSDWLKAVEGVSDVGVVQALDNLKRLLHQLRHNLQEERQQRLKIEHLSSYNERKLKKVCLESGVEVDQHEALVGSTSTVGSGNSSTNTLITGLRPIRMKLKEAITKHEEAVIQANAIAEHILQIGFVPVFEALESFSLQMYSAYEQIRVPSEGSSQQL